jgi:hypothetical protein
MPFSARDADPIEGLFRNLGTLVPLVLALGAWLIATWKKLQAKQSIGMPPTTDEAERTRRVQEEVRRKIAERRGRPTAEEIARPAEDRPTQEEGWRGFLERGGPVPNLDPFGGPTRRAAKSSPPPERISAGAVDDPAVLERQRWLAAQARDLKPAPALPAFGTALDAQPVVLSPWLVELREPAGVRRAIVLREILGPPVGLR